MNTFCNNCLIYHAFIRLEQLSMTAWTADCVAGVKGEGGGGGGGGGVRKPYTHLFASIESGNTR